MYRKHHYRFLVSCQSCKMHAQDKLNSMELHLLIEISWKSGSFSDYLRHARQASHKTWGSENQPNQFSCVSLKCVIDSADLSFLWEKTVCQNDRNVSYSFHFTLINMDMSMFFRFFSRSRSETDQIGWIRTCDTGICYWWKNTRKKL